MPSSTEHTNTYRKSKRERGLCGYGGCNQISTSFVYCDKHRAQQAVVALDFKRRNPSKRVQREEALDELLLASNEAIQNLYRMAERLGPSYLLKILPMYERGDKAIRRVKELRNG